MKTQEIGQSGMIASRVALGVMRMDALDAADAARTVAVAHDSGIDYFDTADIYGFHDHAAHASSKRFGQAWKDAGLDRSTIFIQTKFGIDYRVSNMGPWQIELLQSGLRQKLEINQLQFGLMHTQMLDAEIQFNMASDPAADRTGGILPYSRLKHMTIQAWCPFQSGTEYGPFVGNEHFPELNAELTRLAGKYGSTPNGIAVAWILRHPAGIQPLLGSMTPERIRQMAAGADIELERRDWWSLYQAAGNPLV